MDFKSGYVAIIGKPNVGKSTILNRLLGEKLAIVSPKPQTTRESIKGILTLPDAQVIFVDTPGIHNPRHALGRHMVKEAQVSLTEVDIVLFVLDAHDGMKDEDLNILNMIFRVKGKKVFLVLNKIDTIDKRLLLPAIQDASRRFSFTEYIPTTAISGDGIDLLRGKIIEHLPSGPKYFPDDQLTDKNERFIVAEFIREEVLRFTHEEVPHAVAVRVEEMREPSSSPSEEGRSDMYYIQATIFVERDSQKGIIIGKDGKMMKAIGQAARLKLESWLKKKVYLGLWVKVLKNWRKDPSALKQLGYS